jgi:MFS family permease
MVEKGRKKSVNIFSYGLLVMTLTHILTHSFGRMHTVLFPILQEEFSLNNQQLGIIAAIPPLCQVLLAIPTGALSDRFGSKKLIILSMVVAASGAVLASATGNVMMLIIAVSLLYINTTIYHPAAYSYTTRLFEPQDRSKALGLHGAGGTLGMSVGPISLGILMGVFAFSWRQVYLFWAIPLVGGIITVLLIKSEPSEDVEIAQKSDGGREFQAKKLLTASLAFFLIFNGIRMVGFGMSDTFLNVYLVNERGWNPNFASIMVGSSTLMGIIAAPIGGFLASRYGEKRWSVSTSTLSYVFYGLSFLMPNTLLFVLSYLGYGFLNFLAMAANSAIMARLSPGKQRGMGFALYFLPGSIMGAVGPIIAALIADNYGIFYIFPTTTLIFFIGVGILFFGVKMK